MTGPRPRISAALRMRAIVQDVLDANPDVPALLGVLVRQDGSQILAAQRGVRRRGSSGTENAVISTDRFNIGSISKPITGYVLTCAMEHTGDLGWDSTLPQAFPEFAASAFRRRHGIRDEHLDCTIAHLMTHRSGLSGNDPAAGFDTQLGTDGADLPSTMLDGYTNAASLTNRRYNYLLARFAEPRAQPLGSMKQYTSLGAIAAAVWLERRYRRPFSEVAADRLFTPLGIAHIGWGRTATASTPDGVWQHDRSGTPVTTVPNTFSTRPQYDWHAHGSAGKVAINAEGLGRLLASLLDAPGVARPCSDAARLAAIDRPSFATNDVRMGWAGGPQSMNHNGDNGISYANAIIERNHNRAVAAAANVNSSVGRPAVDALIAELQALDSVL